MQAKKEKSTTISFSPIIGIGLNFQRFRKPEFKHNANVLQIFLPFCSITRMKVEVPKMNRTQKRQQQKRR